MGKHLEQALPSVYTLQCLTGKVDNNNNTICSYYDVRVVRPQGDNLVIIE